VEDVGEASGVASLIVEGLLDSRDMLSGGQYSFPTPAELG